jgi:hypothetical protein
LDKGIAKYLNINTIDGCLDRNNINYNPQAIYDSGNSCQDKLKFGGFFSVYKKCSNFDSAGIILNICKYNENIYSNIICKKDNVLI